MEMCGRQQPSQLCFSIARPPADCLVHSQRTKDVGRQLWSRGVSRRKKRRSSTRKTPKTAERNKRNRRLRTTSKRWRRLRKGLSRSREPLWHRNRRAKPAISEARHFSIGCGSGGSPLETAGLLLQGAWRPNDEAVILLAPWIRPRRQLATHLPQQLDANSAPSSPPPDRQREPG